jgi:hypothetical protein
MASSHDNGGDGEQRREVDTIILTYDRATDHLDIGGHCNSVDLMLDMLGRATRVLELKWRQAEMQRFAAEMRQAAADQALFQRVAGRG